MSATPNLIVLQGPTTTPPSGAATGNGQQINTMDGYAWMTLDLSGTFSATVTFEGTIDGTNWFAVGLQPWAGGALATTATAVGQFKLPTDLLLSKFRARVSAWTSGQVVAKALVLSRNI